MRERLKNWTFLFTEVIPYRPLGIGIGGTSVGAWMFNKDLDLPPIDSYLISTILTCGIPAALLFMWILLRATRMSWRAFRRAEGELREAEASESYDVDAVESAWRNARVWRIATTLMPVLILNSMFGNTFTLYSVAPVAWLLIGWISAGAFRQTGEDSSDSSRRVAAI